MGKISNKRIYETVTPTGSDYLIGTDAEDRNKTKNFKIQAIADFVGQNVTIGVGSLNTLTGALTLVGGDGLTITDNGSDTITISMDRPDYVESINSLIGAVDIVGSTNIVVTDNGNDTITVDTQNLAKTNEANTFVNDQTMTKNLSVGTTVFNVDSIAERVGVNTATPSKSFDVVGDTIIQGLTGDVLTLKSPSENGDNYILFTNSLDSDKGWVGYRGTSNILQIDNLIDDIDISSLTGSVKLSLGGSVKLETTATGVDVNGGVTATGAVTGSNLSGTNTGDQTSIVGITGTTAEFNTALSDGTFATSSDLLGYVTLSTTQTITGQKTFSQDLIANGITVGSGNIQKNLGILTLGSEEISLQSLAGVKWLKTAIGGSLILYHNGNSKLTTTSTGVAVTGDVVADSHVTNGGTSSDFVKGDGSLDSTNYQGQIDAEEAARIAADIDLANDISTKQDISEKNQANGYAPLDSGAKIPIANLPDSVVGQLEYQGTWNASTNTPTLPAASGVKGHYYVVSVGGTYETIVYAVGDWIISNGTAWEKVDNTDAVTSVFGRLGAILANESDYSSFYPLLGTTISAGSGLIGGGDLSANRTISHDDTSSQGSVNNSGGVVIQDVTLDPFGHVTGLGTIDLDGRYAQSSDLSNYVTLNTDQTITAEKTFNNSGSDGNIIVNHTSGSGIALDITKGGSGEGLRVNKTSGSGDAVTVVGTIAATGGNSSEWNTSYDRSININPSFNTSNGVLTLTQQDSSTLTVDLDGRYVEALTDTLDSVTDRGATTTNVITVGGATVIGNIDVTGHISDALNNTFIGKDSGADNTTGTKNVAIGYESLISNTTGSNNVAIGNLSTRVNTEGFNNVAIGRETLWSNTTGANGVAFGPESLRANTTGHGNIGLGTTALAKNTTGGWNVGVGYGAGQWIADGTTPNETSSDSIFIGRETRSLSDGRTNQIVIGTSAIGNGSNTVTIGNDSITDTYLKGDVNIDGKLEIDISAITGREDILFGTISDSTPSKFGIANATTVTGEFVPTIYGYQSINRSAFQYTAFGNSAYDSNTSDPMFVFSVSNTDSSTNPLNGTLTPITQRDAFLFRTVNFDYMRIKANGDTTINGKLHINAGSGSLTQDILTVQGGGTSGNYGFSVLASNGDKMFTTDNFTYNVYANTSAGNFGIGTDNPSAKLQIHNTSAGVATVAAFLVNESTDLNTETRLAFAANTNDEIASQRYSYISTINTSGSNGQAMTFATNATGASATEKMRIDSSGRVGIGATPADFAMSAGASSLRIGSNAHIQEDGNSSYYAHNLYYNAGWKFLDTNAHYGNYILMADDGTMQFANTSNTGTSGQAATVVERMRIDSSGNVGIGTTDALGILDAGSELSGSQQALFPLRMVIGKGGGSYGTIGYNVDYRDAASNVVGVKYLASDTISQIDFASAGFIFRSAAIGTAGNTATLTERMRIDSSGNVGIGNSIPSAKLDVNGDIRSEGIFRDYQGEALIHTDTSAVTQIGSAGASTPRSLSFLAGNAARMTIDTSGNVNVTGSGTFGSGLTVNGAQGLTVSGGGDFNADVDILGDLDVRGVLSKASGSFRIEHPLEDKKDTHHLVHSFVEAPQADNIYRGKIDLSQGQATVNLDEAGRMTEGTFVLLNGNIQCFTSNESGWTAIRGKVEGNILTIEAQDAECIDTISWLVIGERHDQHMIDTEWTDENGRVITEPLKKVEPTPEEEEEEITIIENN